LRTGGGEGDGKVVGSEVSAERGNARATRFGAASGMVGGSTGAASALAMSFVGNVGVSSTGGEGVTGGRRVYWQGLTDVGCLLWRCVLREFG